MSRNPALAFRPPAGTIPTAPGCYQFKDEHGRVLYVGKAKSLRHRLANYFAAWHLVPTRTKAMLEAASSVDWIVVDNEVQALHLEYTLIQRHQPRYNIRYRDDKSYPWLVVTTSDEFPRARVSRARLKAGDRRFGPYAHAYALRETLDLLLKVFPVRSCSQGVFDRARRTDRPCLLHDIGRCSAPCTGEVTVTEHRELVDGLIGFLEGETDPVLERLEQEMQDAADEQAYEIAARRRDQLRAAQRVLEKQQVVADRGEDFDAIGIFSDDLEAAVQAFFVRRGRLVGRKGWIVDKVDELSTPELLTSFLVQLYEEREDDVPPLVLVPDEPDEQAALSELLGDIRLTRHHGRGRLSPTVRFRVPKRGNHAAFLRTVTDNAREAFERQRLRRANDFESRTAALKELQDALELERAPLRIECFDISHLGGTGVVASMVVFEDGLPRKGEYRRFKIATERNDDPAAMREAVGRRFSRRSRELEEADGDGKFLHPPDLVLVDGGPTQLRAALDAVADLDVANAEFAALAKRNEELWRPGRNQPVVLPRGSEALFLVQRVRDEAHRFAITYQRDHRAGTVRGSVLEQIPGIGPGRRKALLRTFGSVRNIRAASLADLEAVPGISSTLAAAIRDHLGEGAT
ncbi:MAG: excinuclease ABC subunit UvrC [Nitriliruptorales bacterium]|nr:excinuclease ABC subunit UvrC [Nitriliruptorales bacterium]